MKRYLPIVAMVFPALALIVYGLAVFFSDIPDAVDDSVLERELGVPRMSVVFKGEGILPEGALVALPSGDVLFAAAGNIISLARGAGLLAQPDQYVTSFALVSEGMLMTVRGDRLGYYYDGRAEESVVLPVPGLRLETVSKDRVCLYGKIGENLWAVYAVDRGGRYSKLFTSPMEISALTASEDGFIIALGGGLYRMAPGKRILPLLHLPRSPRVRSVAHDPQRGATYFSTMDAVYVLARNRLKKLANISGTLRLSGGGLYILSDLSQELLRIDGVFK